MVVTEEKWAEWLERLYNLRRDKRGTHERPHKPVLLLSIIDLLDRDLIRRNEVVLSEELVATFKLYFEVVRRHDDQPTIQNPFFHLSGDKFWELVPTAGEKKIYEKGATRSERVLVRSVAGGRRLNGCRFRVEIIPGEFSGSANCGSQRRWRISAGRDIRHRMS